ncbi:hypothetical protein DEU56DRAFT_839716 [Suillus clintonianus]|uniref:uncharacterized protein n=1 Tax=Suillus clintonianus TaxID=1904413 RepID=UPI001B85E356|nr:uncharacterized protein DEU56DRAFT_839716 [Suillus clintonianus]KAG2116833.1 hypothetical protein DEU56DRAFT_839716 [Suillus clintonianus]
MQQTRPRGRNVVIFGETGPGKSSVINTIAQKDPAKTSNDVLGCTSISERHAVEISGQSFVLFDIAGASGEGRKTVQELVDQACVTALR